MRILDSTSTALPFPDVVVQQYSCETAAFPLQTLMSQASSQTTKCTNQRENSSKLNKTTSANKWRHLMLTRLSITYNVYSMKYFKWAEKNNLLCQAIHTALYSVTQPQIILSCCLLHSDL